MNLNLDYYIDQYDKLILFNAPCFKKRNYQDLINDLYYKIFSKVDLKIKSKNIKKCQVKKLDTFYLL